MLETVKMERWKHNERGRAEAVLWSPFVNSVTRDLEKKSHRGLCFRPSRLFSFGLSLALGSNICGFGLDLDSNLIWTRS